MITQPNETTYKVNVPEVTWTFITGTSVYQGETYSNDPETEAAARRLETALHAVKSQRMGKGYTYKVIADKAALEVLWCYMDSCEDGAYYGDGPSSETYGAKKVKERIEKILGFTPNVYVWQNGVKS